MLNRSLTGGLGGPKKYLLTYLAGDTMEPWLDLLSEWHAETEGGDFGEVAHRMHFMDFEQLCLLGKVSAALCESLHPDGDWDSSLKDHRAIWESVAAIACAHLLRCDSPPGRVNGYFPAERLNLALHTWLTPQQVSPDTGQVVELLAQRRPAAVGSIVHVLKQVPFGIGHGLKWPSADLCKEAAESMYAVLPDWNLAVFDVTTTHGPLANADDRRRCVRLSRLCGDSARLFRVLSLSHGWLRAWMCPKLAMLSTAGSFLAARPKSEIWDAVWVDLAPIPELVFALCKGRQGIHPGRLFGTTGGGGCAARQRLKRARDRLLCDDDYPCFGPKEGPFAGLGDPDDEVFQYLAKIRDKCFPEPGPNIVASEWV